MSYLVTLTFDLNAADSNDYECVAQRLAKIGLTSRLPTQGGETADLPANTFAGEFLTDDRDALLAKIRSIFNACRVTGRVYIASGTRWGWTTSSI